MVLINEVDRSTPKKRAQGYLECTKSMLKIAAVNNSGKAMYCGTISRLKISGKLNLDVRPSFE
jgi:hypothetical protein